MADNKDGGCAAVSSVHAISWIEKVVGQRVDLPQSKIAQNALQDPENPSDVDTGDIHDGEQEAEVLRKLGFFIFIYLLLVYSSRANPCR